jgi:hypothetical protein
VPATDEQVRSSVVLVDASRLTDPVLLELLDEADVPIPRGEPRRRLAEVANALASRAPEPERQLALENAAAAIWSQNVRARIEDVLGSRDEGDLVAQLGAPARENPVALALAYRGALAQLSRDERVHAPLAELEPAFSQLDDDDRARFGPVLARAATPALPLDIALMKDEGYQFVAVFPPEGSEGVDIVGKAAKWLTRRMTMDGDAPRVVMRRFLALLAEEVEIELPAVAETLDRMLAEPVAPAPANDRVFVALARGLVEEAVAERGFPF